MKNVHDLFEDFKDVFDSYIRDFQGDLNELILKFKISDKELDGNKKQELKSEIETRFPSINSDYTISVSFYRKDSLQVKFKLRQL